MDHNSLDVYTLHYLVGIEVFIGIFFMQSSKWYTLGIILLGFLPILIALKSDGLLQNLEWKYLMSLVAIAAGVLAFLAILMLIAAAKLGASDPIFIIKSLGFLFYGLFFIFGSITMSIVYLRSISPTVTICLSFFTSLYLICLIAYFFYPFST